MVTIIVANFCGSNQLAVTIKKKIVCNSNKKEEISMNNTKMKPVNLYGENDEIYLRDRKEFE